MSVNKMDTKNINTNNGGYNMVCIKNPIVGKYSDYLNDNYTFGDIKKQRGYVSRKLTCIGDNPVYSVTSGKRKGEVFVLYPSYNSTRYCLRVYLTKPENR